MKEASVLFICMGNIYRSPTAEGIFRSVAESYKSEDLKFTVDSAGTHAYHIGNPPDSRSQATALTHGVDLSSLVARKVTAQDFIDFDYIIAMANDNLNNLKDIQNTISSDSKASVQLFMESAEGWDNTEVPDPYYGGDNGFEEVYKMVSDASQGLLDQIVKNSNQ